MATAASIDLEVAYADEILHEASMRMLEHDCGCLPVVERENPKKIVDYLGRTALLEARTQRLHEEHRIQPGWWKMAARTKPN